jgi:hypothetical protein
MRLASICVALLLLLQGAVGLVEGSYVPVLAPSVNAINGQSLLGVNTTGIFACQVPPGERYEAFVSWNPTEGSLGPRPFWVAAMRCPDPKSAVSCVPYHEYGVVESDEMGTARVVLVTDSDYMFLRIGATTANSTVSIFWSVFRLPTASGSPMALITVVIGSLTFSGVVGGVILLVVALRLELLSWYAAAWLSFLVTPVFWGAAFASVFLCVWATRRIEAKNWSVSSKFLITMLGVVELGILCAGMVFGVGLNMLLCMSGHHWRCQGGSFYSSLGAVLIALCVGGLARMLIARHAFRSVAGAAFFFSLNDAAGYVRPFLLSGPVESVVPWRTKKIALTLCGVHAALSFIGSLSLGVENNVRNVSDVGMMIWVFVSTQMLSVQLLQVLFGITKPDWTVRATFLVLSCAYYLLVILCAWVGMATNWRVSGADLTVGITFWSLDACVVLYMCAWFVVLCVPTPETHQPQHDVDVPLSDASSSPSGSAEESQSSMFTPEDAL